MKQKIFFLLSIVMMLPGTSPAMLSAQETSPSGGQVLGIAANPRTIPEPSLGDYLDAAIMTHDVGVNGNIFAEKWSSLETADGINVNTYVDQLNAFEDFFPDTALMGIQVINTTTKETPADLLDVPFDDPRMLARFEALVDALLARLDHPVRYLSIGNEVDVYLENQQEWDAYTTFYEGAVAYVHQVAPEIQVGVTVTNGGLIDYTQKVMRLNEHSDVMIVTYYPLGAGFTGENPDAPLTDFPAMIEFANGLPIVLQEVGYPSAELLDSSEAEQAQFVRSVFAAWRDAGDAIPFLDFFLLHDLPEQLCSDLEGYYGLTHPNFHAYLCTLGLRQTDGTPKQAWDTFVDEARQWAEHRQR